MSGEASKARPPSGERVLKRTDQWSEGLWFFPAFFHTHSRTRSLIQLVSDGDSVEMPPSSRARQWRRRGGSYRQSFMSTSSQDSTKTFGDVEEEFLHAAEFGDIPGVKRLLGEYPELNIDCIDALGRTALRLAVNNEHLEVVEVLLERSNQQHIYEAVLQSISAGHTQIAESILKHRRYLEMWREMRKLGDTDGFFKTAHAESQFSPDVTPLILAAQKNQYEIVQLLLMRGELIQKPHKFNCLCLECRNKMKFDELRMAKSRLNAYKGLTSEAYISLSSKDPILTAFEFAKELTNLSKVEKHFKMDYKELASNLSDYVVKILDRIRTQEELNFVLNKTGRSNMEKYESLARFRLALQYKQKRFVAHPVSQQRLIHIWYNGMGRLERAGWIKRFFTLLGFAVSYPILVLIYIVAPGSKFGKVLQYPFVKFVSHSLSFVMFLVIIIISSAESSLTVSKFRTLKSTYYTEYTRFRELENSTEWLGIDFPLRQQLPTAIQIILALYILGFLCQECSEIFKSGLSEHIMDLYNLVDYLVISVYTAAFTLSCLTMIKFETAITYLRQEDLSYNIEETKQQLYWLNADRWYWKSSDPINIAEGLYAMANIISFSRISYLLPANEALGPLQISLGRMLKDILKFMSLFSLVIMAFMVGLHNLFWYYSARHTIEVTERNFIVNAEVSFGDSLATFRTVFWSLFGRGEPTVVELDPYQNTVTQDIGYILYGAYNITMVTVLLNMLIAMMTRSFTNIAEDSDVEWKFSRSLLYMDYIVEGSTLPVPLNLIYAPKAAIRSLLCRCSCKRDDTPPTIPMNENDVSNKRPRMRQRNNNFTNLQQMETGGGLFNPACEASAVDIYEGNASSGLSQTAVQIEIDSPGEVLTYQKVMQRIIQRYIFDIQREAEVTEDDFEEIKQDISSFRYEVLNQWRNRECAQTEMANNIIAIGKQLETITSEFSQKTPTISEEADES